MLHKAALGTALTLFTLTMVINSCSTDVDLAAPYKSTPVIVGVLDVDADTQFFRINRTFLTQSNPNSYASVRDSIEYADGEVDAWLIKYNGSNKLDSIQLQAVDIPSRDPGVFYDTDVRMFIATGPLMTPAEISNIQSMSYEMRATLRGTTYRALTNFPLVSISDITIPPLANPPSRRVFVVLNNPTSVPFTFAIRPSGARYSGEMVLVYDEELEDGTITERKELRYDLGSFINQDRASGTRNFTFNATQWFNFVGSYFKEVPNLKKVRIHELDHRLYVGNEVLSSYMSVANPVSQFIPVFNTFSNFDNDAIGILGSIRSTNRITWIEERTLTYMKNNEPTSDICFCVYWTGTAFTCDASPSGCP